MNSPKGISLSINTIVIITLGVVVLVVVFGFFFGGFSKVGKGISGIGKEGVEEIEGLDIKASCHGENKMTDDACEICAKANHDDCSECPLCEESGTSCVKRGNAKCEDINKLDNAKSICNSYVKAKGCWWGYAQ